MKACEHELRKGSNSTWRCMKCNLSFVGYTKSESYLKQIAVLKTENNMLRSCLKRLGICANKSLKKGFASRGR